MNDPTKISVGVAAGVGAVSLIGAAVAIYTIVSYRKEVAGLNDMIFYANRERDRYRDIVNTWRGEHIQRFMAADAARAQRERAHPRGDEPLGGKRHRKTRGKKRRSQRR
jgi:hypothetical protein